MPFMLRRSVLIRSTPRDMQHQANTADWPLSRPPSWLNAGLIERPEIYTDWISSAAKFVAR